MINSTLLIVTFFVLVYTISRTLAKNLHDQNKPHLHDNFEEYFKNTLLKDPAFLQAQKNIMNYSKGKTMAREYRKPYSEAPNYGKNPQFIISTNGIEYDEKGQIIWNRKEEYKKYEDLNLYKKDLQFIDLNKQAQNEGIQNQNFAEIVYMLEEYISMLHNYPDQIHSVAEIQRKAIFEKFIILKKQ